MGALDDLTDKTKDFIEQNKEKVSEVLNSEKAEDISDKVLDGVSEAAKKIAGEHADKIDAVRNNIDGAIGTEK